MRTLQEFLVTARWDHARARDTLQRHLAAAVAAAPADATGTVGVIDETSCRKWGEQTPGVQRQYLGCVGKLDNGIVTVHVGVAKGTFQALLDADLYLPKSWDQDRPRCRAAGIPDDVRYRPKWRIALDQSARLGRNGIRFDWLVFDEGYGATVPLLEVLGIVGQRFVAEVPVNFAVRDSPDGPARRADERLTVADAKGGRRYRLAHRTVADSVWRATTAAVGRRAGARVDRGRPRGDGGSEVLSDQRDRRAGGPCAGGGLPALDGGARVPAGQAGGGADGLRRAGLHEADPAPDPVLGGPGVRGDAHGAAAGGKIRG